MKNVVLLIVGCITLISCQKSNPIGQTTSSDIVIYQPSPDSVYHPEDIVDVTGYTSSFPIWVNTWRDDSADAHVDAYVEHRGQDSLIFHCYLAIPHCKVWKISVESFHGKSDVTVAVR